MNRWNCGWRNPRTASFVGNGSTPNKILNYWSIKLHLQLTNNNLSVGVKWAYVIFEVKKIEMLSNLFDHPVFPVIFQFPQSFLYFENGSQKMLR